MNRHTNYRAFTIDDFVWDDDFRNWVLHPDVDSNIYWRNWINANPDRFSVINAAKEIVLSLKSEIAPLSGKDKQTMIDVVLSGIHPSIVSKSVTERSTTSFRSLRIRYFSVAASIVFLIAFAFWLNSSNNVSITCSELVKNAEGDLFEQVNNTDTPMVIRLDDGSMITLEKDARISRVKSFHKYREREIYLSGEAFFEVSRDVKKPFFVYAGGLVTKVLGTSFRIRSYDNEEKATVEVKSGLVAVYSMNDVKSEKLNVQNRKVNTLLLTPNLKADYYRENEKLIASIVDKPVITAEKKVEYRFVEISLSDVFDRISTGYGIEVIYDKKILGSRTLTANLEKLDLYQKIEVICKVTNARYEIIDGKIVLHHSGKENALRSLQNE